MLREETGMNRRVSKSNCERASREVAGKLKEFGVLDAK